MFEKVFHFIPSRASAPWFLHQSIKSLHFVAKTQLLSSITDLLVTAVYDSKYPVLVGLQVLKNYDF